MFKIIALFSLALMVCSCNKAGKPDSEPMSQDVSCDTSSAQIVGDKAYKNGKWWNKIEQQIDYNDKGDTIHEKWSNGSEVWSGSEVWYDYDAKGNEIHEKWSNGNEYWYDYDAKGNEIHRKWSSGIEMWYAYDYKKIAGKCRVIREYSAN